MEGMGMSSRSISRCLVPAVAGCLFLIISAEAHADTAHPIRTSVVIESEISETPPCITLHFGPPSDGTTGFTIARRFGDDPKSHFVTIAELNRRGCVELLIMERWIFGIKVSK